MNLSMMLIRRLKSVKTLRRIRSDERSDAPNLRLVFHIRNLPDREYRRTLSPEWIQAGCWTPPATNHIPCHRVSAGNNKVNVIILG